jgi:hypothetical protein
MSILPLKHEDIINALKLLLKLPRRPPTPLNTCWSEVEVKVRLKQSEIDHPQDQSEYLTFGLQASLQLGF